MSPLSRPGRVQWFRRVEQTTCTFLAGAGKRRGTAVRSRLNRKGIERHLDRNHSVKKRRCARGEPCVRDRDRERRCVTLCRLIDSRRSVKGKRGRKVRAYGFDGTKRALSRAKKTSSRDAFQEKKEAGVVIARR